MSSASPANKLAEPIERAKLAGPARAKELRRLGVNTIEDLVEYFPRTYQSESAELKISQLKEDQVQMIRGEITAADYLTGRKPRFEATVDDGTGVAALVFFNSRWIANRLHPGSKVRVKGKVKYFRNLPQFANPKWEIVDDETPTIEDGQFRSIYPASEKLPSDVIAKIIQENLPDVLPEIREFFDPALLKKHQLVSRPEAYRTIHIARDKRQAEIAYRRLVFDELMLMQIGLGIGRQMRAGRITAPLMRVDETLDHRILRRFPFMLTVPQRNATFDVARDLTSGKPMNRLLQGDVGSGKTVVALYAMLVSIANKMQSAMLAPTEILAEQHYFTLKRWLEGSSVRVELFTQRTKKKDREALLRDLSNGQIHLAVGTQALIQEDIEFGNLGLVVVDEQHRLGVQQRATLKSKGLMPHYLVMTATPIPRTLALSYFADFDVSTLDALPPGRQPIRTKLLPANRAIEAYEFALQQIQKERQAFVVVPRIEDDGDEGSASVQKTFKRLSEGVLSSVRIGMLHGKMSTDEKQRTMIDFRDRKLDVLVATTVIEVGVDVPNATVMVIEQADSFGLAQLHQLRGRVGRGEHASHCLLISDSESEDAHERLKALCDTTDGFALAETDMKLRGPGQFFGTRQHGLPEFKLVDLSRELELLKITKEEAIALLKDDPRLTHESHRALRQAIIRQFGTSLELAQIG